MAREPPSLYNSCLVAYVKNLNYKVTSMDRTYVDLRMLPTAVLASVYEQMCNHDSLKEILLTQLTDLNTFNKVIRQASLKQIMFKCVQTLMTSRRPVVTELRTTFCRTTSVYYLQNENVSMVKDARLEDFLGSHGEVSHEGVESAGGHSTGTTAQDSRLFVGAFIEQVDNGIRLGSFLCESGWLEESLHVFNITLSMVQLLQASYLRSLIELNCLQKLLCAQTAFCCFKEANITCAQALNIIDKLTQQRQREMRLQKSKLAGRAGSDARHRGSCCSGSSRSFLASSGSCALAGGDNDKLSSIPNSLLANIYQQISVLHFYRSEYDLSYRWSIRALKHINKNTPDKIIVDVLRQVAKSCVVKRQFQLASMLIKQAVCRARSSFGTNHQKYADALLDYGFFLLNVDSIANSVAVYTEAHEILCRIFGPRNLHVAVAHEDLAYCLYVLEYSSGKFDTATANVERAIDIMKELVPCNHLMLASAKRVKALILEEIALDTMASTIDYNKCKGLLLQSEELHQSALHLSLEAFGEINVQTAKHYGNLGRLYQSMSKFDAAEQMHKRAIKIKTHILGPYDYEVGLSIGHLASLYNYHMQKHQEAEELYLKSIEISLRLFGESYSGLEYDYRGLIHIYDIIGDQTRYDQYSNILDEWRLLREENQAVRNNYPAAEISEDTTMEEVTRKFFEMCSNCITGSVPLNESDGSINHNLLEADGVRPECVCGNDCTGEEDSEELAAAAVPAAPVGPSVADEILRSA
ncbi:amyloid protein-binding protein 2 [Ochlerotatus camptorhynchus]|uniref:amyloid protein-binding protein 2 n=1 Tax=Ochlerotatus camptorhynchus TaxID=644619 RepID=UPI0031CDCBAD